MAKSKMNKFSLSNYSVRIVFPNDDGTTITYPTKEESEKFPMVEIGGEGDYIGQVDVAKKTDLWTIDADATGAWVYNQNLDRTGTCKINIRQVSDKVMNLYYYATTVFEKPELEGGAYISIQKNGETIVECEDCMVRKVPDLPIQKEAQQLSWEFLCGSIKYTGKIATSVSSTDTMPESEAEE